MRIVGDSSRGSFEKGGEMKLLKMFVGVRKE